MELFQDFTLILQKKMHIVLNENLNPVTQRFRSTNFSQKIFSAVKYK